MTWPRSLQARLGLSLGILLTILWIAAASETAVVLRHEMDEVFDCALQESAKRELQHAVVDIVGREEDGVTQRLGAIREHEEFFTYIVRDAEGRILLQSHTADPAILHCRSINSPCRVGKSIRSVRVQGRVRHRRG